MAPEPVERFKRNRHRGAIVALANASLELERALLPRLERALFTRGMQTFTLAPRHLDLQDAELDPRAQALVARNLAEAGVVCLLDETYTEADHLKVLRWIADARQTAFIVIHLEDLDAELAATGRRALPEDEDLFGDADVRVSLQGLDSHETQIGAIVEQLVPLLQRF